MASAEGYPCHLMSPFVFFIPDLVRADDLAYLSQVLSSSGATVLAVRANEGKTTDGVIFRSSVFAWLFMKLFLFSEV